MPEKYMYCDAIVTFADAERWASELFTIPPTDLEADLVQTEPALVGIAMNLAARLQKKLLAKGVEERIAAEAATATMRAGVICAEMTRRGFRKFNASSIEEGGVP